MVYLIACLSIAGDLKNAGGAIYAESSGAGCHYRLGDDLCRHAVTRLNEINNPILPFNGGLR